ncbi:MAG: hypothetical protein ABIA04_08915 [Pseudomonadota bacterium]
MEKLFKFFTTYSIVLVALLSIIFSLGVVYSAKSGCSQVQNSGESKILQEARADNQTAASSIEDAINAVESINDSDYSINEDGSDDSSNTDSDDADSDRPSRSDEGDDRISRDRVDLGAEVDGIISINAPEIAFIGRTMNLRAIVNGDINRLEISAFGEEVIYSTQDIVGNVTIPISISDDTDAGRAIIRVTAYSDDDEYNLIEVVDLKTIVPVAQLDDLMAQITACDETMVLYVIGDHDLGNEDVDLKCGLHLENSSSITNIKNLYISDIISTALLLGEGTSAQIPLISANESITLADVTELFLFNVEVDAPIIGIDSAIRAIAVAFDDSVALSNSELVLENSIAHGDFSLSGESLFGGKNTIISNSTVSLGDQSSMLVSKFSFIMTEAEDSAAFSADTTGKIRIAATLFAGYSSAAQIVSGGAVLFADINYDSALGIVLENEDQVTSFREVDSAYVETFVFESNGECSTCELNVLGDPLGACDSVLLERIISATSYEFP